jgi:hypothetical protein
MSVHLKKREIVIKNGRNRKKRPKTFASKEAAESYAKAQGYKKYTVEPAKKTRFKVIEE